MVASVLLWLWWMAVVAPVELPTFRGFTIVSGLSMGYQVVLVDLNRDRRLDVVVIDERSDELAWYENPTWDRHVLASGVSRPINLDGHDLDGDGVPEIALAHHFETNPDRSVGQVLLLTHDKDPRQPWRARPIDRVPTAHRVRWMSVEPGKAPWLLVSPLVGPGVYAPAYAGRTPIYAYRPPDPAAGGEGGPSEWTRRRIASTLTGVVHSVHPIEWTPGQWHLLTASFDGLQRFEPRTDGDWTPVPIHAGNPEPCPRCGSSEVKVGVLGTQRFLAAIEPWHGDLVTVYLERPSGWERVVIEDAMVNGHALAVGDLDGDGRDEIVASFRGKGARVSVYRARDAAGSTWTRTVINEGAVAGADCKIADLTGDRRPDIVCSGASTGNVMLFEHQR